jgi:hypothetical protein
MLLEVFYSEIELLCGESKMKQGSMGRDINMMLYVVCPIKVKSAFPRRNNDKRKKEGGMKVIIFLSAPHSLEHHITLRYKNHERIVSLLLNIYSVYSMALE